MSDSISRFPFIDSKKRPEVDGNLHRQLITYKNRKKQAAVDAQLILNRIALLQKEEERSRKKIEQTKEKAVEIVALRIENDRKVNEYVSVNEEEKSIQMNLRRKNLKHEIDSRRHKLEVAEKISRQRQYGVAEMKLERNVLSNIVVNEREKEYIERKNRHEVIRQMQEEAKRKREFERKEAERRHRELLAMKAHEEAIEAKKAEQLIKLLELKEKEWINKLRDTQRLQEATVRLMEEAVLGENVITDDPIEPQTNITAKVNLKSSLDYSNQKARPKIK